MTKIDAVEVGILESRPGRSGASTVAFPAEWGTPPSLEKRALKAWIKFHVLDGQVRQLQGETIPWVVPAVERR
jgi:hypothetical protein